MGSYVRGGNNNKIGCVFSHEENSQEKNLNDKSEVKNNRWSKGVKQCVSNLVKKEKNVHESNPVEKESKEKLPVVEEVFKQEVAYKCGNERDDEKETATNKEVDISEVVKQLVLEAHRKKNGSRPNSRVFSRNIDVKSMECNEKEKPGISFQNNIVGSDTIENTVVGKNARTCGKENNVKSHIQDKLTNADDSSMPEIYENILKDVIDTDNERMNAEADEDKKIDAKTKRTEKTDAQVVDSIVQEIISNVMQYSSNDDSYCMGT